MDFSGWEKLSLLDYDNRISCTLFTAGCNFRCPFCHNGPLVLDPSKAPKIPWDDIMEYLKKRKNVLDAVCVSGGEPTLMPDLLDKLSDIKSLGYLIKLDTNGTRPEVVEIAAHQGLVDYVAMDIKDSFEKYPAITGTLNLDLDAIQKTIHFLMSGEVDYEFRTTLIAEYHTEKDMEEIGSYLQGAKRHFLQRYIDNQDCIAHGLHMVPYQKALVFQAILQKYITEVSLRGYDR